VNHTTQKKLLAYLKRRALLVDKALNRFLVREAKPPEIVHKAMRYSVFAGGKRLRPILCMAATEICGGNPIKSVPTACALEVLHTYSLVHDDLPAMDDDDLRRGRPTNHKVFGDGMAILAGDGLLTFAFELMARNAHVKGVRAEWVVEAILTVAQAAGSLGMVGGQAVDLVSEGNAALNGHRAQVLDYIHRHKTGALIEASLGAGAVLAGATPLQRKALAGYGENIGLAFQIADDVLDIVGDKHLLGKRGSDKENQKLTFPSVYGLEDSRRRAHHAVTAAKKALEPFGRKAVILSALADYMIERDR
jgi:geranylgeranyl diphosphate synthase type II